MIFDTPEIAVAKSDKNRKHLLLVLPLIPGSPEKCALMLILERCQHLGWDVTVLVAETRVPTSGDQLPRTTEKDWHGLRIINVQSTNWRRRFGQLVHRLRPSKTQRQINLGRWSLSRRLTKIADLGLGPVSWVAGFPDQFIAFKQELCSEALYRHQQHPFDLVASFYYPFSSHLTALRIAQLIDRPWVAFTQDFFSWPASLMEKRSGTIGNMIKRRLEQRTLSAADVVIAYSDNLLEYERELLSNTPVKLLMHCYDDEDFPEGMNVPQPNPNVFEMLSLGLVAKTEEADLRSFFESVSELLTTRQVDPARFRLRFLGAGGDIVRACAVTSGCNEITDIGPSIAHDAAMNELRRATCLLYQQSFWGMRRRLPEYFGARKPILGFPSYPYAMSETLLKKYGAACVAGDKAGIKSTILRWYKQFHDTGTLQMQADESFVQEFRASRRAAQLNSMLMSVLRDIESPSIRLLTQ